MKSAGPKTLAERLDWMAKNLPGFADELEEVARIPRRAASDVRSSQPKSLAINTSRSVIDEIDSHPTHFSKN